MRMPFALVLKSISPVTIYFPVFMTVNVSKVIHLPDATVKVCAVLDAMFPIAFKESFTKTRFL